MTDDPKKPPQLVHGGRFYGVTPENALVPLGEEAGAPDLWICRRVADFPGARVPEGGAVAACARCRAAIVFNPARTVRAPKVCMQCADVQPLPLDP